MAGHGTWVLSDPGLPTFQFSNKAFGNFLFGARTDVPAAFSPAQEEGGGKTRTRSTFSNRASQSQRH